jgi:hypothetical protein
MNSNPSSGLVLIAYLVAITWAVTQSNKRWKTGQIEEQFENRLLGPINYLSRPFGNLQSFRGLALTRFFGTFGPTENSETFAPPNATTESRPPAHLQRS